MNLIRQIARLFCGHEKEPKPQIGRFAMPMSDLQREYADLGIKKLYGSLDPEYYYTNLQGWGKVFGWIYFNCELPKYSVSSNGKWNLDCEDFAIWLKAMISLHFGLNCFAITIGDMPRGRHGFNMLRAEDGHYCWEPNPGFNIEAPFAIGEHGYQPLYNFV